MSTLPASAHTAEAPPPRRRRWLLRALGVLLLLLIAAGAWLLGTQGGLDFALARARAFTHGALSVQQAQGRLWGSLRLRGVQWRSADGLRVTSPACASTTRRWRCCANAWTSPGSTPAACASACPRRNRRATRRRTCMRHWRSTLSRPRCTMR